MRKRLMILALVLIAVLMTCTLAACSGGGGRCSGGHTWDEGTVKEAATCTESGTLINKCTVCGIKREVAIEALGHDLQTIPGTVVEPTCEVDGYAGKKACVREGCEYVLDTGTIIPAIGHAYGDWTSNGDGTHKRVCANDSNHVESGNCSGGTADCGHKAVCDVCGGEYGDFASSHVFDKQVTTDAYKATDATCEAKATYYYSCQCGEKGTETFEYGNYADHVFDREVADAEYLVSVATCTSPAIYNKSCACGLEGTETFEFGDALGHTFDNEVVSADYKATDATCTAKATYYYSCDCGAHGTATFAYGDMLAHVFDKEVAEDKYLASAATCEKKATYYKSCYCGHFDAEESATFESGELGDHVYDNKVVSDTYKATDATCTEKATYYFSCDCGKAGTETFENGETLPHTYDKEVAEDKYLKYAANCASAAVYYKSCACGHFDTETSPTFYFGAPSGNHVYDREVATDDYKATDATCTTKATYYYSCECGEKGTTTFEAGATLDHTMTYHAAVDAICVSTGNVEYWTCSTCSLNYDSATGGNVIDDVTTAIDSTNHVHTTISKPAVAPDCENTGLTAEVSCADCDKVLEEREEIPALGHDMGDWFVSHEPTCTVTGVNERTCKRDDCDYFETEAIPTIAHSVTTLHPEVPATCIQTGTREYYECENCDKYVVNDGEFKTSWGDIVIKVDATNHVHTEKLDGKAANCTETGLTEGEKCTDCGATIKAQEEIPALGHSGGAAVKENVVAATCIAEGSYDNVIYCSVCDHELSRETITTDKVAHTGGTATCVEQATCSVCGEKYGDLADHSWDEGVVTTPATCTTEGVKTFTCTVDGCGESRTETIEKSAHNFVDNVCEDCQATLSYVDKTIGFTFGENGNAEHKDGSPDKATYTETKDGYTLSISGGSKMYPGSFDAKGNSALKLGTSSVIGSFEFTVPADVTEVVIYVAQYKTNTTKISVNGVAYTITTTSNDGAYTEIKVDTTVNKKVSFTTVSGGVRCMINTIEFKVSAENICNHENREVDEVVAPTCTVAGHTTYVCPDCRHTFDADFVDATGHTLVSIPAVAPTCENTGLTEGEKCSVCGHVTIEQTIDDMLPCVDGDNDEYCDNCGNAMCEHTYGDWTFVDEDAHKHVCSKCGKEEVAGHNYEVIAHVDATCEEAGSTKYACADCGDEYTETHVALGHNETPHDAKDPTCSAVGWEAYVTCSRCDYTTYVELPIDADAHKWDEGEVQTPATCTEAGERLHTCEHNTEHTKVEVISATGHTPVKNVCSCGYEYSVDEIIALAEALAKDTELKGTYRLTGVITSVDTEFSTQFNNVTVTISVDGTEKDLTIQCFRMKGEGADKIGVGDTITVSGAIKRYGTTLEFDTGCALESYIPAEFEVYLEVFGKGTVSGIPAGTLARGDEVTFTVTPDTANKYEIDRVTINGSTLNGTDGVYTFTVSANTTINVSFKKEGQESSITTDTATIKHTSTTTTNMSGNNDAAKYFGLDETQWTIKAVKNGNSTNIGLNKSGDFRLYYDASGQGKGNAFSVSLADGVINSISISFNGSYNVGYAVLVNENAVEAVNGVYTINASSFTIQNINTTNKQVRINSISVTYAIESTSGSACAHENWSDYGVTTPATCSERGVETATCYDCGETKTRQIPVDPTLHVYNETITTPATCTQPGLKTLTCECGDTKTEEIAATGHNYNSVVTAPTCTADGYTTHTCSVCGDTYKDSETSATGHNYNSVVTAPTCTADGYTTHTCLVCGDTYKDNETSATGHSYNSVVTAPTCTTGGYTTYTCACGHTYTADETEALGHTEVVIPAVAPSCESEGKTEGKKCSVCGTILIAPEAVDALGHTGGKATCTEKATCTVCGEAYGELAAHTEEILPAVDATCTETGLKEGKKCSVCGEILVAQEEIALKDHTAEVVAGKPATCTETGLKDGSKCSVCGKVLVEQEVINALEHDFVAGEVVAPTCTADGYTIYDCSRCEATENRDVVGALGHKFDKEVAEAEYFATSATCIAKATYYKSCTCGHFDAEKSDTFEYGEIAVDAHDWDEGVYTEPTCTADGYTTYTCKNNAEHKNVVTKENSKLDHTYDQNNADAKYLATPATCIAKATYYKSCTCGHFDAEKSDTFEYGEIAVDAHDWDEGVYTEPTCTADGYTTYTCKNNAEHKNVVTKENSKLDHTYDQNNTDAKYLATSATCIAKATYYKSCACGHFDAEKSATFESGEVNASAHDLKDVAAQAHTCTEDGWNAHKACTRCDYTEGKEIDKAAHTEVIDAAVEPTCTETGLTEGKHCSDCGTVIKAQEVIGALGHTWGIWAVTTEATCTKTGVETRECSACHTKETRDTALASHTEVTIPAVDATCTTTGLTEGKKCSVCGEILVAQEEIAAKGHTEVIDAAVAPTCTATGLTEGKHCSVCKEVLVAQTVVNALGHEWEWVIDTPATVTSTGLKHEECTRCDATQSHNTIIDILICAHTDTLVHNARVDADCENAGNIEYWYCTACEKNYSDKNGQIAVENITIPATGHNYNSVVTTPTCTADGYTTHTCANCGDTYTDTIVGALGHTEVIDAAVAPTCTETGLTEGKHCSACDEVLVAQEVVEAKGHRWGNLAVTSATCTVDGYITITCGDCGIVRNSIDHDEAKEYLEQYPYFDLEAKGHDYQAVVTAPTCTADGYTTHTCSKCADRYVDTYVDALGHDLVTAYEVVVVEEVNTLHKVTRCVREGCEHIAEDVTVDTTKSVAVANEKDLRTVLENGFKAQLAEDVDLVNGSIDLVGVSATLDLNGYNISVVGTKYAETTGMYVCGVFYLDGATLTIDGKGELFANDDSADSIYVISAINGSNVTLNGGTYRSSGCTTIYGRTNTTITIIGGTYIAEVDWEGLYFTLDILESELNGGTNATINVYGGTFHNFDPANHTNDGTYTNKVMDGYHSIKDGDNYVVGAHTEVVDAAVDATCTATGLTGGKHCSVCDKVLVEQEVTNALGHDEISHVAQAPTCTEIGWDAYVTCSRCDYTTYVEKAALGHDEVEHDAKAPTCTEIGWDAYVTCSRCDYTTYAEKGKLGHDYVAGNVVAPGCETDGYTIYKCSRCEATENRDVVAALGHNLVDGYVVIDDVLYTADKCDREGCDHYEGQVEFVGEFAPVSNEDDIRTVLENGFNAKLTGDIDIANGPVEIVDKNTVVYLNGNSIVASGTAYAETTGYNVCGVFLVKGGTLVINGEGRLYSSDAEADSIYVISALDGAEVTIKGGEYVSAGSTAIFARYASHVIIKGGTFEAETPYQGVYYTLDTYLDKDSTECTSTIKVYGGTFVNFDPANHTNDGTYTNKVMDGYHSIKYDDNYVVSEHTEVIDAAVAPTCTATGLTEGKHCSVCEKVLVAQEVVKALDHSWVETSRTEATCVATGVINFVCEHDNSHTKTETIEINANAHDIVERDAKAPTCTEIGWDAYEECSRCDYTTKVELEATGHKYDQNNVDAKYLANPATCTEKATYYKSCSCGHFDEEKSETFEVDGYADHTGGTATCTEKATCTVCGEAYGEFAAHTEETLPAVDATCTTTGLTAGKKCSACGEITVAQEEIAAKGHTEVTDDAVDATCTTAGKTEGKHCSVCGAVTKAQQTIPATGHNYNSAVTAPTCTAGGYTTHTCTVCGDTYEDSATDALGHDWSAWEQIAGDKHSRTCANDANHVETESCSGGEATCEVKAECSVCEKEYGTLADHKWETVEVLKEANCFEVGSKSVKCSTCEATETQVIEKRTHNYVDGTCQNCGAVKVSKTEIVATFEFGENGSATHTDGTKDLGLYSEEVNGYELSLSGGSKMYPSSYDAKGNSCIKLGSGSAVGKFTFTVPSDVTKVILHIAGYKGDNAKISVNGGAAQTITTLSNNGAYTKVEVDTTTNKTVSFTTVSGGYRAMMNKIEYCAQLSCDHTKATGAYHEPTCEEDGYTVYTCDNESCDYSLTIVDEGSKLGHDLEFVPEVAPNCVDNGNVQYWHCDRCGNNYAEEAATTLLDNVNKAVDPSNHKSLESIEVAPTCTETGLTGGERCTACDTETIEPEIVNATGHIDTTGDGLCDNEGCNEPTCPGHEAEEVWEDDGTGNTHIKRCKHCNVILETEEHSMIDNVFAPTCTDGGYTKHTCADCGYTYNDSEKDALGHNLVYVNDGNSHHQECDRENCEYATATENHTYSSLKDKDATYHTASCVCGASIDEEHVNNGTGNCNCGHVMVVPKTWQQATSINVGDTIAIVCTSKTMQLTSISTTSTKYGIGAAYSDIKTLDMVYVFTVVDGSSTGTYAFKNSSGQYLYWTSGNSLATNASLSANTSWTVSFDAKGNAIIKNAKDTTRILQWNASSPRFACYTSSQTAVQICVYK